jgi:hypothetical protein
MRHTIANPQRVPHFGTSFRVTTVFPFGLDWYPSHYVISICIRPIHVEVDDVALSPLFELMVPVTTPSSP